MFNKIVSNYRKTSESYKTRENAFNKTRERLFFEEFSVRFRTIFRKFRESTEKFRENIFFGELSVNVRNIFVLPCNELFMNRIARAVL